jgi:hypothetical protein
MHVLAKHHFCSAVFQNSTVQINKTRMLELFFPFSDGDDAS